MYFFFFHLPARYTLFCALLLTLLINLEHRGCLLKLKLIRFTVFCSVWEMALLTPSAWQKRLSLCQSPGPARKWLSVAMGQQLPGRHLGQLKPWECLSYRHSGHFCLLHCTVFTAHTWLYRSPYGKEEPVLMNRSASLAGSAESVRRCCCFSPSPFVLHLIYMPEELLLEGADDDCHFSNDMHW